jgi:hypothetical protein
LCDFLAGTADGVRFREITGVTGVTLLQLNRICGGNKEFRQLYYAAKDSGEEYRRMEREDIAQDHAVNGVDKAVYQQGRLVGHIKEFDHRLLEFLLKSDNPAKYREQSANVNIQNNVQSIVVEMHRSRDIAPLDAN